MFSENIFFISTVEENLSNSYKFSNVLHLKMRQFSRHDTTHKYYKLSLLLKSFTNLLHKHITFKDINLNVTQRKHFFVKSNLPNNGKARSLSNLQAMISHSLCSLCPDVVLLIPACEKIRPSPVNTRNDLF